MGVSSKSKEVDSHISIFEVYNQHYLKINIVCLNISKQFTSLKKVKKYYHALNQTTKYRIQL